MEMEAGHRAARVLTQRTSRVFLPDLPNSAQMVDPMHQNSPLLTMFLKGQTYNPSPTSPWIWLPVPFYKCNFKNKSTFYSLTNNYSFQEDR